MKNESSPPQALRLNPDEWLRLSMIIFGVIDAENVCLRRVMGFTNMQVLYKVSGKISQQLMYHSEQSWGRIRVLLTREEADVLLLAVRWYEDTLLAQRRAFEYEHGINELIKRYEILTRITRAIQTAPAVHSDQ
jgi:hypothetical protein